MASLTAVVLVTHGKAGMNMVEAAQSFLQVKIPELATVGVEPHDSRATIDKKIDDALAHLHVREREDVLFLVDLVGSTPARLCCHKCSAQGHVVTGVNMPMLIKLATVDRHRGPVALGDDLVATGTKSIHHE